jgi:pimeloyl-ACP methyl ester carboxylesterase
VAPGFHPNDCSFNRANALYLAHASDVAYDRAPAAAAMERLGLRAVPFRHKLTRTRGFLGVCDTHAVLAFRGTDPITLPNWLTDAVVRLVRCHEYDGRVHYGFSSALRHTWDKIQRLLDETLAASAGRPLFLTGHSMGGALAVLSACRLAKMGRTPAGIYTFGSPRVGDPTFCAGYALPTWRIVNGMDLVPEMPLASVARLLPERPRLTNEIILQKLKALAGRVPCYGHVRQLMYIDRAGQITCDAQVSPWHVEAVARALSTGGKPFIDGIKDHLISNYIRALEKPV